MADIIFIAIALGFFALCAIYVRWCDRIIGPDVFEAELPLDESEEMIDEVAA
ncbi:MAG: hypothetical protein ABI862_13670 [Ilumatobacteraceae bacterium]